MIKLVFGVGINDADYKVKIQESWYENGKQKFRLVWVCPFYRKWDSMLKRCYYEKYREKHPTYVGCTVCEEWLTFSNFKKWMEKQNWQDKHLDKDILFPGNKVYSPETCVFVDAKVNKFLTERGASRGEYMIGVNWDRKVNKFKALCGDGNGKQKHLGYFDSEIEAHHAWLAFKLEQAKVLANRQTDKCVAKALIERYTNYEAT